MECLSIYWPYLNVKTNVNKLLWTIYEIEIQDSVVYEFTWAAQAQNETFITTSYEYGRFSQVEVTRTWPDFTQKFQLRCLATHAHTVETG